MEQTNLQVSMNADASIHPFDMGMDDKLDLPKLIHRYYPESEDDDSDEDDNSDDDDYDDEKEVAYDDGINTTSVQTTCDSKNNVISVRKKVAPNRLVNVKKIKSVIERNMIGYPVCNSSKMTIFNGNSLSLAIIFLYVALHATKLKMPIRTKKIILCEKYATKTTRR